MSYHPYDLEGRQDFVLAVREYPARWGHSEILAFATRFPGWRTWSCAALLENHRIANLPYRT